jgi:hypothetical protein
MQFTLFFQEYILGGVLGFIEERLRKSVQRQEGYTIQTRRHMAYNTIRNNRTMKTLLAPSPTTNGGEEIHRAPKRRHDRRRKLREPTLPRMAQLTQLPTLKRLRVARVSSGTEPTGRSRLRSASDGVHCAPKALAQGSANLDSIVPLQGLHQQPRQRLQGGDDTVMSPLSDLASQIKGFLRLPW